VAGGRTGGAIEPRAARAVVAQRYNRADGIVSGGDLAPNKLGFFLMVGLTRGSSAAPRSARCCMTFNGVPATVDFSRSVFRIRSPFHLSEIMKQVERVPESSQSDL